MEKLQVGGKERLLLLSHDLEAATTTPGSSSYKVWRPQLLLLLHGPAVAATAWQGGSSNISRRSKQHGICCSFRVTRRQ